MATTTDTTVNSKEYQHLISEKGREVLRENRLIVEIEKSKSCPFINNICFAGMFKQIPLVCERPESLYHNRAYTVIKANEVAEDDDDTVKNVLARLGYDLDKTYYLKVYSYELETPNEKGLTQFFTTNKQDATNDDAKFAGFTYVDLRTQEVQQDTLEEWVAAKKKFTINCLKPISLWLNEKWITLKILDADSGQYINEYDNSSNTEFADGKILMAGVRWAEDYRNSQYYERDLAIHNSRSNVLPDGLEGLLSNETLTSLCDLGLRIEVTRRAKDDGLLDVIFRFASNSEFVTSSHGSPYDTNPELFNTKMQKFLSEYKYTQDNKEECMQAYLQSINAA